MKGHSEVRPSRATQKQLLRDSVQRGWERTVKYYENLRVVYEIQTQLKEWSDQQPDGNDVNNGGKK